MRYLINSISNGAYLLVILFTGMFIFAAAFDITKRSVPFAVEFIHAYAIIGYVLKHSKLIKTSYFYWLLISIPLLFIGSLFKLMHWPYAHLFLLIGFIFSGLCFSFYWYKKPTYRWIDYLKLSSVIVYIYTSITMIMHWPNYCYGYDKLLLYLAIIVIISQSIWSNRKTKDWLLD